jgi:sugar/nucleoside kinase (ribokinase family)
VLRRLVRRRTRRRGCDAPRDTGHGGRLTRVAIVGSLTVDRVGGGTPRVGGAVYYGARAAVRLNADAVAIARCAEADRATCLQPLEELGLAVVWRRAATTAAFSFRYEGDRRVMEIDAVADPWLPADVAGWMAPALDGVEWVHAGALVRSDFPPETLEALAAGGRRVLIDAQGLVRRPRTGPLVRDGEVDHASFRHLAMLKLSESEARILAGGVEPDALRRLGVPEILLTLGSSGSLVVAPGVVERIDVEPIAGTVDPTGAGDSFSFAYLAARAAGIEPAEAARTASRFVSGLLGGL